MLVFSDAHPGDDEDIAEKKRILAALDFPRPEVIINTFSFQTSASDPQVVVQANEQLQSAIGGYNDALQAALYRAWFYLEKRISEHNFFDPGFHDYLTKRYVGRLPDRRHADGRRAALRTLQPEHLLSGLHLALRSAAAQPDRHAAGGDCRFQPWH